METIKDKMTVAEIENKYDLLGIPHFQRGLVWNDDSSSLLLESLYYNTPIGSFVLWKQNKQVYGKAYKNKYEYLIIDGQQRINTIHQIFTQNTGSEECWCINIEKALQKENLSSQAKKSALFVKISNPVNNFKKYLEKKESEKYKYLSMNKYQYNFVPISQLLSDNKFLIIHPEKAKKLRPQEFDHSKNPIFLKYLGPDIDAELETLKTNIKRILKAEIPVRVLYDKYAEVINVYNRINSGGIKASKEEIIYANISQVYTDIHKDLDELFKEVHDDKPLNEDRIFLRRMREKNFGFKFFIHVINIVVNHKRGTSQGKNQLNFTFLQNSNRIRNTKLEWKEILKDTKKIVIFLKEMLEEAGCDDFRFLPDVNSLLPAIFYFIKKNGDISAIEKTRLGKLTFSIILAEMSISDILKIQIRESEMGEIDDLLKTGKNQIDNVLKTKTKNTNSLQERFKEYLKNRTKGEMSIMNRYTLMFYWVLKNSKAKDFNYEQNIEKRREFEEELKDYRKNNKASQGEELFIDKSVEAEKEHLIVYSQLKNIYGDINRGKHIVSNIGNITFISKPLNSGDYGKFDRFMKIDSEPSDNLKKHCLMKKGNSKEDDELIQTFNELCKIFMHTKESKDSEKAGLDKKDISKAKKLYEEFIEKRRELIIESFLKRTVIYDE